MPVAVMGVGKMRVTVPQDRMRVPMGMRPGRVDTGIVLVPMMGIVPVAVTVLQRFVRMLVLELRVRMCWDR